MWRKWRQVLTPLNIISTLPLLFAMLCGGYLSYRYNILLRENRDLVVHTYQVINAIDGLLIRLEDAETGQRGYIITGDASSQPNSGFPMSSCSNASGGGRACYQECTRDAGNSPC